MLVLVYCLECRGRSVKGPKLSSAPCAYRSEMGSFRHPGTATAKKSKRSVGCHPSSIIPHTCTAVRIQRARACSSTSRSGCARAVQILFLRRYSLVRMQSVSSQNPAVKDAAVEDQVVSRGRFCKHGMPSMPASFCIAPKRTALQYPEGCFVNFRSRRRHRQRSSS